MPTESARSLLLQIDEEQRRLRELLSGKDDALLAQRPPNGRWSVLENLRHLVFTEQGHLGLVSSGAQSWSAMGLPPGGLQARPEFEAMAASKPSSVKEVLDAWQVIHKDAAALAKQDTDEVRKSLSTNLRHLRNHITVIQRLIRASSAK